MDATAVLGDFSEAEGLGGKRWWRLGLNTYDDPRVRCESVPRTPLFAQKDCGWAKIDAIYVKGLETQWTCVDEVIKNESFISDHLPVHAVVSWASKGE